MGQNQFQQLKNPPIQEAIIDIQFELVDPDKLDLKSLENFADSIKTEYPKKSPKIRYSIGFAVSAMPEEDKPIDRQMLQEGFVLTNDKEKKVVQLSFNNFTFNKLNPYTSWEEIKTDSKAVWENFTSQFPVAKIKRVALRYINKIELETPIGEKGFDAYLRMLPSIPSELSPIVDHFTLQVVMPMPNENIKAIVTQTFETKEKGIEYLLDIDTYQLANNDSTIDELWLEFEKIRNFKNQIFFNSTTDLLRSKFN